MKYVTLLLLILILVPLVSCSGKDSKPAETSISLDSHLSTADADIADKVSDSEDRSDNSDSTAVTNECGDLSEALDTGNDYVAENIAPPRDTFDVKLERLNAPTNVAASDSTYNDKVVITWSHPSGMAPTTYYIYRSETADNPSPTYIGGKTYPGTSFHDTTATPGTTYYYKLKSHKSGYNDSYFSTENTGTRSNRMNAPTGVTASDDTYNDKIAISWSHPDGVTPLSYYIYRSTTANDPNPTYIGVKAYPNTLINDTTATLGTTYYYKIKSHKVGYNDSYFSNEDSGSMSNRLSSPQNLNATDGPSNETVHIWWSKPTGIAPLSYYIYRSTIANDPNPTYIGLTAYPSYYYNDYTATPGTIYYYKAKTHKPGYNDSYFSNENSGYMKNRLDFPINVDATDGLYTDKVRISWEHPPNGMDPTAYYIYRSTTANDPSPIYIGGRSYPGTYYDDFTVVPGTIYYYKIKSHKSGYLDSYFSGENAGHTMGWIIDKIENTEGCGPARIAIDSSNVKHVCFHHHLTATLGDLMYAINDGSGWEISTVDAGDNPDEPEHLGDESHITIDSNDKPHVAYFDSYSFDIRYAYYNGSSWETAVVDSAGVVGYTPYIAADSSNNPHISYFDNTNRDLKYAYFDESSWLVEIVDGENEISGGPIAIDSDDHPHIAYHDGTTHDLKYAFHNGTDWVISTLESEGYTGLSNSLVLDSNDYAHISYYYYTDLDLKYKYFDGTDWITETVDSYGNVGAYTSLALDSNGYPHIIYRDEINKDLKYAYNNGSSWVIENVDTDGDTGCYPSLALDSNDKPYVVFNTNLVSGIRYATRS